MELQDYGDEQFERNSMKKAKKKCLQRVDHAKFLELLRDQFPEVPQAFDQYGQGLLHCEMGTFAQLTEKAMDDGRFWQVHKYFRFLEKVRANATPELENAIDVSYLESLAFREVTENRHRAIKQMPKALRAILLAIDRRGRWK
jgi:hypothetical protein